MAALGTFTNGLANELNNPLAIIAGHRFRLSSMIDSRSFNIHEFEKSLGKIDQAVNRMIAVIDALKVYSQDPQGQEILKTFSLRETIKYTIDLCRDKVVSRGIKLLTPELGDATMEGHQGQLIQVLLILIDNAIDALEHVSEKTIRIELQPLPDTIRIAVIDSGPGVPLGLRNKIWDPFFTSKDPFRHKGLGLSIASGIISNHRGRVLLDEATPETRFVVELPRTRRPLGLVQTDANI
jgi:signal transduction histidine kinase